MIKNILFYYHHFGGLGHGIRIYSLCKAIKNFLPNYKLLVINSGVPQPELGIEKYAKVINLPYFKAGKGLFSGLYSPNGLEVTFRKRKKILVWIADKFRFHIAIFEHFPFGRDPLEEEIAEFIKYLKHKKTLIYSSVRDIIMQKISEDKLDERLRWFDGIFVHSEENMGLLTGFRKSKELNKKIIYTNRIYPISKEELISKRKIRNRFKYKGKRLVVVSIGGGIDGLGIIKKIIQIKNTVDKAVQIFCLISAGASINESIFNELNSYVGARKDIVIKKFIPNYPSYVNAADLSISMAGYNSINNTLFTKTKTFVFPRKSDSEQQVRARYFSKYLEILDPQISNEELASKIVNVLRKKFLFTYNGKFNGAETFTRLLDRIMNLNYLKIRLTTKCNLNCDMCSWKYSKEQLDYSKVLQVLDQAKLLNIKTINFTGGEPTLYTRFYELIEYVKKQGFLVSVSTNGIFGNKNLVYFSKFSDFVDISINSYKQELDDKIKGKNGAFRLSVDTIRNLNKLNRNIKVHINVTVRPDNLDNINKIVCLLSKYINSISFTLIDTSINKLEYLKFNKEQLFYFYFKEVPLILKECIKNNIQIKIRPFFKELQNFDTREKLKRLLVNNKYYISKLKSIFKPGLQHHCVRAKTELRINSDGEVSPCCYLDDYPINLGNICKSDLLNIVSSDKYFNFINLAKPNCGWCKKCAIGYTMYSKIFR